ncbi:MAG: hypothetical protein J7J99_02310, partial [Thermoprotei archaeon]|nr:hypothetical protein [Thermoprotei archaeon]
MCRLPSPRENFLVAVNHNPPYWIPCPMFDGSVDVVTHGIVERRTNGTDDWGVGWVLKDPKSDSFPVYHPIRDPSQVEDYPLPSPERPDLMKSAKQKASKVDRRKVILAGDNGWGLFERAWLLVGMHRLFRWSFTCPDAVEALIRRIAEIKVRITERYIEEVGIDMILYGDDWGMEDRLLFSPHWWRRFIKPWQAELYRVAKKHGVLVYQHSDGKVEELIPDLIEIGVDILNIQRECNDWNRIKREYGDKITLWGGVSARTLDRGSPDDVRREVEECIDLGKNGGLILAPGHALKYPRDNIEAMHK